MSTADEVRTVSKKFYDGLTRMTNGTSDAISNIWAHTNAVTSMHPISGRQVGWDAVGDSFNQFARLASDGRVELKEQNIQTLGDVAYETGIEYGHCKIAGEPVTYEHRVTNIYHREGGEWKMIHHHSDPSPGLLDALSRLQAAPNSASK